MSKSDNHFFNPLSDKEMNFFGSISDEEFKKMQTEIETYDQKPDSCEETSLQETFTTEMLIKLSKETKR